MVRPTMMAVAGAAMLALGCYPEAPARPDFVPDGTTVCAAGDDKPPCNGCPAGTEVPSGWVCVPAGEFVMGQDGVRLADPSHRVGISRPFLIMTTEVTQGQWFDIARAAEPIAGPDGMRSLPGEHPSHFSVARDRPCDPAFPDECPLEMVNVFEAMWYANQLSARDLLEKCYDPAVLEEGVFCSGRVGLGCNVNDRLGQEVCDDPLADRLLCPPPMTERLSREEQLPGLYALRGPNQSCTGYRLPTKAEWEYAARAGTETRWPGGEDASELAAHAHFSAPGAPQEATAPVGRRRANAWGLFDMLGNVQEWVHGGDVRYLPLPEAGPDGEPLALVDPVDIERIENVARGGAYSDASGQTALESLNRAGSSERHPHTGFRLVRTVAASAAGLAPPRITELHRVTTPAQPGEPTRFPRLEGLLRGDEVVIEATVEPGAGARAVLGGALYLVTPNRSRFKIDGFTQVAAGRWRVSFPMSDVVSCIRAHRGTVQCTAPSWEGPSMRAQFYDSSGRVARIEIEAEIDCAEESGADPADCGLPPY